MKPYKTITLRLNAAEYDHLRKQTEATGLKMEPLLRQLILGVNLRPRPPDEYAALLRELSAIGNNVNQLAHQANARGEATRQEIGEAAGLVRAGMAAGQGQFLMAYTKILVIHNRLDKCLDYAQDKEKTALSLAEAIDYALNRDKTEQACFETGINCDVEAAWRDMLATKRRWGKVQRKRQGYHIIQSFAPGEVTPEEAHAVGVEFAQRLFGERYEAIVTTHLNKAHLHNHVVVNSVSMLDGAMYRDTFQDYYGGDGVGIRGTSDATCQAHGLSVIEPDPENPDRRRSRPEWAARPPSGTRCAMT